LPDLFPWTIIIDEGRIQQIPGGVEKEVLLNTMPVDYSLYLVADAEFAAGRDLIALVDAAVRGGVTVVQIRGKDLPFRDFLDLARTAVARLKKHRVPLLINDRVDIALASGAAGVHLGQDDMPVAFARKVLASQTIIGVSVNSVEEALEAERLGADYVGLGPIYPTGTKTTSLPVLGPAGIREVKARVSIPVVAIGGISPLNACEVHKAGADGIAVVSALLGAADVKKAARELKKAFGAAVPQEGKPCPSSASLKPRPSSS
jgi:thiamine-phosphate pyrophosphorylase